MTGLGPDGFMDDGLFLMGSGPASGTAGLSDAGGDSDGSTSSTAGGYSAFGGGGGGGGSIGVGGGHTSTGGGGGGTVTGTGTGTGTGAAGTGASGRSRRGSSVGGGGKLRVQLPASCDPPLPDTPTKPLVWIVFGGTGHMGRSLVKCAVAHGDYVVTVGRTRETTPAAMRALATASAAEYRDDDGGGGGGDGGGDLPRCVGALCDVRARESVDRVVQRALAQYGRIDVVANCSGYGVVGACEDQDDHELRNQFETNVMGTLHILQATLPILRRQQQQYEQQQQSSSSSAAASASTTRLQEGGLGGLGGGGGRYLIFSSTSGALGVPGLGPYCATKYAVEGLIEAMLYEVDAFNIKATLVEPGLMRRDDDGGEGEGGGGGGGGGGDGNGSNGGNGGGGRRNPNPLPTWGHFLIKPPSEPYAGASSPALHATRMVQWLGDRQPASVVQCAELVWQLAHCSFPPLRLPLGSYAIESIRDRLRSVTEELEDWKHLNFPLPPDASAAAVAASASASASASAAAGTGDGPAGKADRRAAAADEDEDMDMDS